MRAILLPLFAVLFIVSACQSQPLFPENNTTSMENVSIDTNVTENIDTTVNETVNETPQEDYAAVINAVEGELVALDTKATDPDGDAVTLSFAEPFNEAGKWQTQIGDAGEYEVAVTASDGKAQTTAKILVVLASANSAPEITGPDTITVKEGEEIDLGVFTIVDPDGDEIITSYAGFMRASTYTTNYNDAGEHTVRVIAEDSKGNEAEKTVTLVVENVNRKPRLDIAQRRLTAIEGNLVVIDASATDADGDDVTLTYEEPFNEAGEWKTVEGDAGEYTISVTATDGEDEDVKTVYVTIEPANRPPVITVNKRIEVDEGETIDLDTLATVTDPEGDDVTVTYSGWMTHSTYKTTYDDAGEYQVTITATDGSKESTATLTVVVNDVNRAPVFIRPA